MTGAAYPAREQRMAFIRRLVEEMRGTPSVEAASATSLLPSRLGWPHNYIRDDRPPPPSRNHWPRVGVRAVGESYYDTYGIPLIRGRAIDRGDTWESERVPMVNSAFANFVFPDEEPLDRFIRLSGRRYRIVGVFDDFKNAGLTRSPEPEVNVSLAQWQGSDALSVFLTLRTSSNPLALAPVVTEKVRRLNPDQPLNRFEVMQAHIDRSTAIDRFRSLLVTMFAVAALILASVGIYGVVSYSVAQRTNEMGIRMALGARGVDLLRLILRQGLQLTVIGVVIGLAGAVAVMRVLASQLYDISATDPSTFLVVAAILGLVGILASLIPAIRAMRVSPITALRYD